MKEKIPISRMAAMHGISRQTLIYYDTIGLFKPAWVAPNGYRYYEAGQIPYLREIVLLKNLGMSLEAIKDSLDNRSLEGVMGRLSFHEKALTEEIGRLKKHRENVRARLCFLREAGWGEEAAGTEDEEKRGIGTPFFKVLPPRPILFFPFEKGTRVDRESLHYALLSQWELLYQNGEMPAGFGTLIPARAAKSGRLMEGAGAFTALAGDGKSVRAIPGFRMWEGGLCACLNRYGMPYEPEGFNTLTAWIREQGYEVAGDISDACVMDTTFYDQENQVDLCCLQIPCGKREAGR